MQSSAACARITALLHRYELEHVEIMHAVLHECVQQSDRLDYLPIHASVAACYNNPAAAITS